ncbi:hypothetical protein HF086_006433 [Spodoptera exigua]|uniref:Uncharacterized protein n=1 Tax=Spodoptera exigua TaxID=7107 RepID=A0A922SNN8_SPOEX|nr:hypothetical protein HF086_006433 [Spodoptera exigua]
MLKTSYQALVLYHVSEFVCRVLMRYRVSLEILKKGLMTNDFWRPVLSFVFVYFWIVKSLFLENYLNVCCEQFYILLDKVEDTCAFIMSSECSDADKRLCKNIRRLYRSTFSKMSACGMFYVDATFPFKIISLISTYNIVLIQFAFLY